MAEAAERRIQQQESRGVKDPESVKRAQQRAMERERMEEQAGNSAPGLRWTQD